MFSNNNEATWCDKKMIYYILFFLIMFLSIFDLVKINKNIKTYIFFVACFLIIVFGGLRDEVGTDWYNYKLLFLGEKTDVEYSYIFLSNFFKSVNCGYSSFLFFIFILAFYLKAKTLKKYSKYPIISLLVYIPTVLIIYDMNGIRQGLALGITLYSFKYIIEKNKIKFFLSILIATTIHISAIVFLPAFFISKLNIGNKMNLSVLLLMLLNLYFNIMSKIIISLYSMFPYRFFQRVYDYSIISKEDNNIMGLIQRLIIFIIAFYFLKRLENEDNNISYFIKFYTISTYIYILFYNFGIVASRGSAYYKIFELILIPLFLDLLKSKVLKIKIFFIIVLYLLLIINKYLKLENNGLVPYKNIILEKM